MDEQPAQLPEDESSEPTAPGLDPDAFRVALDRLQSEIDHLRVMIAGVTDPLPLSSRGRMTVAPMMVDREGAKVIEGTFDGQNMTGPDGKQYSVPANYASKSKLVEGDVLKLTITRDGSFIYKQIGPVERRRVVGALTRDEMTGEFRVVADDQSYKILLASVTYFKGEVGDQVVVLLPQGQSARWGAVENIIKSGSPEQVPSEITF